MGVMSSTAKRVLSPTAVALGASTQSEDAEGAYVPLKAFYEAGSESAKALYKNVKKAISEGTDEDTLYTKYGVYMSDDGDYKVDLPEIKARNQEYADAVTKFVDKAMQLMDMRKGGVTRAGTMKDYLPEDSPVFENFPDLRDTKVDIKTIKSSEPAGLLGSYTPSDKVITVYVPPQTSITAAQTQEEKLARSWRAFGTLIHEFQHNIQDVKGSKNVGANREIGAGNKSNLKNDLFTVKKQLRELKEQVEAGDIPENYQATELDLIQRQMALEDMLSEPDVPHAIYIRELGEAEARSSGMKASLPHEERVQIGVFYPKHQRAMKYDKEGVESSIVTGETPVLDKEEILVRVETPKRSWYEDELVLASDERAKKGKGFVDLPSNAIATALGLDTTRRVLTESMDDASVGEMDSYVQGRTGFKPSEMSYAESDVLTDTPIVGDVLFAADILAEIGNANQMEEGEEQPEAVDEFTGVEFAGGGLMEEHMEMDRQAQTPKEEPAKEPRYEEFGMTSWDMLAPFVTGTDDDVVDAAHISRSVSAEKGYDDNDRTEDTMRHVLLGGLVYGNPEKDGMIEKGRRWIADKLIDVREGGDPESKIDLNNNEYGRQLRQLFPDREEFIEAVKTLAEGVYKEEDLPDIAGVKPQKSFGSTKPKQNPNGIMSGQEQ